MLSFCCCCCCGGGSWCYVVRDQEAQDRAKGQSIIFGCCCWRIYAAQIDRPVPPDLDCCCYFSLCVCDFVCDFVTGMSSSWDRRSVVDTCSVLAHAGEQGREESRVETRMWRSKTRRSQALNTVRGEEEEEERRRIEVQAMDCACTTNAKRNQI